MAFKDALHSIGIKQHVSGPTHRRNHTLDIILSYGLNVDDVKILQQSEDISDHYLMVSDGNIIVVNVQYGSIYNILCLYICLYTAIIKRLVKGKVSHYETSRSWLIK